MRHKSKITQKGYAKGRPNKYKGQRFYADTYTREEVFALVEGCNCGLSGLRDRALIVLLYRTGLRINEALTLRVPDVDFERGQIRVRGTKTKNADRIIGLDALTRAHLTDWLDVRAKLNLPASRPQWIFCCISLNEKGNRVKPAQTRQKLHRLAEKAGITKRVHPHGFRHTFAAEMANEGADLRIIKDSLGHTNIAITDRYISHHAPMAVINYVGART